jgi:hypothetical protein
MRTAPSQAISLALALLVAAPAEAAETGRVVSAVASRAYLDRGTADGLAAGQSIALDRGGEHAGTCVIEEVCEHFARCKGVGLRPGDQFRLGPAPAQPGAIAPLAPPPSPEQVSARRAALVSAPVALVAFAGGTQGGAGSPALQLKSEAEWSHTSWMSSGGAPFHDERIAVAIRGLEIGRGFRVWADLSAQQWETRPETARYRPGVSTQVFINELAVANREIGNSWTVAAGRVRPWSIPGISLFDGAQASLRTKSGSAELGVFGGELPDVQSTGLQKAWLAGLYWNYQRLDEPGAAVRVLRHEGRLAILGGSSFDRRFEAEAVLQASFFHSIDAGADARVAYSSSGGVSLDAARVDLSARPAETVRIFGGYRYDGVYNPELASIDPQYQGRGQHADLAVSWDVRPYLTLGASGGFAQDIEHSLMRAFVGPEIGLPRLLGSMGGLSLGYSEELGWSPGRTGWVQLLLFPAPRWQLLLRPCYFQDSPSGGRSSHEVGLSVSASAQILTWLSARASVVTHVGVDDVEVGPPFGVIASISVRGAL